MYNIIYVMVNNNCGDMDNKIDFTAMPTCGIACDGAHSEKNKLTQYQAVDLNTGELLFREDIGYQTVNIGEYLGLVSSIKHVLFNIKKHTEIYCDSLTAIRWVKDRYTASNKSNKDVDKAEMFVLSCWDEINRLVTIHHWDSKKWGENPADFGNK